MDQAKKGVLMPKIYLYAFVISGFLIILLVGLLSGLVGRPNNCISRTTLAPVKTTSISKSTRTIPTAPSTRTNPAQTTTASAQNIRLPNNVVPLNYRLYLEVDFQVFSNQEFIETERFIGEVEIHFNVVKPTKSIILHADRSLNIEDNIELTDLSKNEVIRIKPDQHEYLENQLYEIKVDKELKNGEYILKIDYIGGFGKPTNIIGFYKTKYEEDGITKYLLGSKFQPTDARRAFPCFDEPALKATFEISINHPNTTYALSNWPSSSVSSEFGGRLLTTFKKTYPMSTYLAAWAVLPNDFGYKEDTTANGRPVRVYARKDAVELGLVDHALETTKKSIDFFENEYFYSSLKAIPPKIDMIAFPDFPSSAMEHWGLVGYKETSLLYKEGKNPVSSKQSVAFTIAHEVSHFWFGDLVTCKWWNDLWLNEAMARFLQFKAVQYIFPDWNVESQFLTLYKQSAMYDDGISTSSPVAAEVLTPAQINSAFSSITYDKGSSLLIMLEDTVGKENFRQGLNNYLEANEFSSSEAANFYNSLKLPDEMQSISPQEYMENWLNEPNFPEVSAVLDNRVNADKSTVKFIQSRFLLSQAAFDQPYLWKIYIRCKVGGVVENGKPNYLKGTREISFFLQDREGSLELDKKYSWIKCNNDFKGFYTTDYSDKNYVILENLLLSQFEDFSIEDRANILNDAFLAAYSGAKSYSIVAWITNYLEAWEKAYVPWRTFTLHMSKIAALMEHRPAFSNLRKFGIVVANSLAQDMDLFNDENDDHLTKLLKANLVDFLCRMQQGNCLKKLSNLFDQTFGSADTLNNLLANSDKLSANLKGSIYKYHVQNTYNYIDWLDMYSYYEYVSDPQEKAQALNAITQTRSLWTVEILLYDLLQESKIRAQDFFTILINLSRNPSGRHLSWYFLRHYWYEILAKFGPSSRALANAVKSICESFENEYLFEEMYEFFDTNEAGAGELQRRQALDIVLHNIYWIATQESDINENLAVPYLKKKEIPI